MKHPAYQIGVIRDHVSSEGTNVFEACLDIIQSAKNMKESYNSPSTTDVRFEDLSISTATSLSYSIWHAYNKVTQEQ